MFEILNESMTTMNQQREILNKEKEIIFQKGIFWAWTVQLKWKLY